MKKKIIVIILAILVGCLLAFFTLTKTKLSSSKKDYISMTVLQTGVFSNYENALQQKNRFDNAIIYYDQEHYLVLVGASTDESGLAKIEKILNEKNISFYKKKIQILEEEKNLFLKYNMLLEKAQNEETVLLLNQKILEKMSEV